ncbi:MAG TPA: cyclic nucleotide-gated ion channel [Bradyrhizobium sp.]|nr:cyclic nucleotide-gated ion channel [Bradyrhizobium sp.]
MSGSFLVWLGAVRKRLYVILEQGSIDATSIAINYVLVALIVATLVATVLESVPAFAAKYSLAFRTVEFTAVTIFSLEYLVRIWIASEHPPWRRLGRLRSRFRFVTSPWGLIDLAAILPFWLALVAAPEFKTLLVLRLLRFLKLTRYSPAMRSLLEALYSERRALAGCFVILLGTALIAAALMHLAEGTVQPGKFGTIPDALWWAIVTLGTIGYGDAVPITPVGRMIAGLTIFAGLLMIALPVGIVATAFANEVHRRDFVITWGLLARIPLFSELSAAQIGEIMKMLRAQKADRGEMIARRGEPAHAMYLIADGEVEIRLGHQKFRMGTGHFFGEIAALRRTRRSATITATQPTRLLALDAADLHALMDREPQLADRIREAARAKLGHEFETTRGDLVPEEIGGIDQIEPDHGSRSSTKFNAS